MQTVKKGDTVKVHYKGTLTDGTLFDSSEKREPLEFKVGEGMVIHGFDNALIDMQVGDQKTVNIPVLEAYGPINEQMIFDMPKDQVPEDMTPEIGMDVQLSDADGNIVPAMIVEIKEDALVLDANHPLAGKDLNFDIELVGIN